MPPDLSERKKTDLLAFLETHQDCVIKPLDGMGGQGVFHLRQNDDNQNVIIETLTDKGIKSVMMQRYLPEIKSGDKRIILINGEAPPYLLARIPPHSRELRGNLAAGGIAETRPLDAADQLICQQVGPWLKENGLSFVGIDVIGTHITEINITSPTGVVEIEEHTKCALAQNFINFLQEA